MNQLKRFIIERDIPGIGAMSQTELCGASRASNQALDQIGSDIQWQHSYVARDKTFCVYLAKDESAIKKHAELSGIPVSAITESPKNNRSADSELLVARAETRKALAGEAQW